MHSPQAFTQRELSRRAFFQGAAAGGGVLGLNQLLQGEESAAEKWTSYEPQNPLSPKPPHFAPQAKNLIYIFLAGAPSHVDLFDPKPKLRELDGQPIPASFTSDAQFAFIKKESARLAGSPYRFQRHGESGMELSELLPKLATCADELCLIRSMHTDAFNHHPAQLLMNTGVERFGRPTVGSWLAYGLGSEAANLPAYVVLTAGRGASGGASNWSRGFLPSTYNGVLFRQSGEPVLNLANPEGVDPSLQRSTLDVLAELNRVEFAETGDPEIASRIQAYELAFRMQSAAPELIDLSDETQGTLDAYGVGRSENGMRNDGGGGRGEFNAFATNCLLARRMVERGVRTVSLFHATWDHHEHLDRGLRFNCMMADQPIAALIKDLQQRDLLDSTLVVWTSEFGRTPLGENRPSFERVTGRDHHPAAFSTWMAGGGVRGGTVVGATDEIGWNVTEDPAHVNDFHATLLHLFGLDHHELTYPFKGLDVRLTDVAGEVIEKVVA